MKGFIVVFEFGGTPDRMPLKALGLVDLTRCSKGQEYWHIRPVYAAQGSPLPRWVEAGDVVSVLNAEMPAVASIS